MAKEYVTVAVGQSVGDEGRQVAPIGLAEKLNSLSAEGYSVVGTCQAGALGIVILERSRPGQFNVAR